jgi:putative endonuclease
MPIPVWWSRLVPFGRRSEIDGARYLRSLGFRVVASRYRTRRGEIDLIAWDGDTLVFIEVKSRRSVDPPEDVVNLQKQRRIAYVAQSYIARYRLHATSYRFDILAITVRPGHPPEFRLLRNAFTLEDSGGSLL